MSTEQSLKISKTFKLPRWSPSLHVCISSYAFKPRGTLEYVMFQEALRAIREQPVSPYHKTFTCRCVCKICFLYSIAQIYCEIECKRCPRGDFPSGPVVKNLPSRRWGNEVSRTHYHCFPGSLHALSLGPDFLCSPQDHSFSLSLPPSLLG